MKKISQSLSEIVENNPFLQFGLYHRLLNLSQLAQFIRPLIEVRTKKSLQSDSSLIMALSRLQKEKNHAIPVISKFSIENVTVHSHLCTITYMRDQRFLEHLGNLYQLIQKNNGYISLSQGMNEVTIIVDAESARLVRKTIKESPKNSVDDLAALGIKYDQKYFNAPGMLYYLMQQIFLQGINILEISSTFTEIIIYVKQKDIKLLFDTIYDRFGKNDA
ncbi:MAG: hypothetical protein WC823_02035 [Parcubacteria group bacterium]|jgi:aspartokinase